MTREEIIEKIKSYNTPELSEAQLYEIGVMHKQLPKSQRDWTWVAELVDWRGSSEAYRHFTNRRMRKENILPVSTSDNAIEKADESELVKQKQEIFKERQRLRDERTNLNRTLRDESRIERLMETITEAATNMESLPVYECEITDGSFSPTEAIAPISDWHIGMEIDEYCNKYDLNVANKRVNKWVHDVCKYALQNEVSVLHVLNLGDLIAGDIHITLRIQEEFDVVTQVMKAGEILARALNALTKYIPTVIYRSCSDNHSRITPNKNEHIEKESFFRLIDWFIKERLKDNKRVEFCNDNISVSMGKFHLHNGKLVMFAHGHLDKINNAFQGFIGATEEYVHYVFLGHYHCEKVKTFQNMKVIVNGSLCGTDPYAESIRKYTKPSQLFVVFDEDNVITHSIGLDVL